MDKSHPTSIENTNKVRHGMEFEADFIRETGIQKAKRNEKPTFVNSAGKVQTIDFDFCIPLKNGKTLFVDTTTSYGSDRGKQKAYNGLLLKLKTDIPSEYVVCTKGWRGDEPVTLEGIDRVLYLDELAKYIKENKK